MAAVIGRGIHRSVGDRNCMQSPMAPYLMVVITLNAVAVIGGAISQFDIHKGQNSWYGGSYDRCDGWLFTNGIFGVLHILGALYIVRKIRDPEDAEIVSSSNYQMMAVAAAPSNNNYQVATPAYAPEYVPAKVDSSNSKTNNINPKKQKKKLWGKSSSTVEPIEAIVVQPVQPQHSQQLQPNELPQFASDKPVVSRNAQKSMGAPYSWPRIKHVMCENWMVAAYFLTSLLYLAWHFFIEFRPCNQGMYFCQKTADIFIVAAPASFVFSVIQMLMERRQL